MSMNKTCLLVAVSICVETLEQFKQSAAQNCSKTKQARENERLLKSRSPWCLYKLFFCSPLFLEVVACVLSINQGTEMPSVASSFPERTSFRFWRPWWWQSCAFDTLLNGTASHEASPCSASQSL